ncbi:MAG: HlyD family type I secretion periplasmic adaptor subunit [Hyphomicrobium sp.]|nr:HlyD family type I secretion periplasmic adaptor subunit [Hyphomicrobium sp.]
MIGIGILLLGGSAFCAWAVLAPLDGAVVTSGSFVATGQNKRIQHLEGGIISDVLVEEGAIVEGGQPLVKLDDTAARTKLRRLIIRQYRQEAVKARLEAQIQESAYKVPDSLAAVKADLDVQEIVRRQIVELDVKRQKTAAQVEVFRKEIASLQESISGYHAQANATQSRLQLFGEELKGKKDLLDRQLARRTEVLSLKRAEAGLAGELGELLARTADAREKVARAEQQISEVRSAALEASVTELRQVESELDDLHEQIQAATDILNRTVIRAPVKGVVVRLYSHTIGGVIGPGASILDIVPLDDELIIEARVRPSEITQIEEGQNALVRLTALNQRVTPAIEGRVTYLSADKVKQDGKTDSQAQDTYLLRVSLDTKDRLAKVPDFKPLPGMPAEVFVTTGERTFFQYIIRPVADSFSRAFREQ